jgi:hypothetical protein
MENSEFLPKFHVVLHSSHTAFPLKISKFQCNAALSPLQKERYKIPSTIYLKFSTSCHLNFFTFQGPTLRLIYVYQKDERAVHRKIRMSKILFQFSCIQYYICHAPTLFFFSSVYLKFQIMWSTTVLKYRSTAHRPNL